jgi:hypothetical protein
MRKSSKVAWEVVIEYKWEDRPRAFEHSHAQFLRSHEASDIYQIIGMLNDYAWMENAKSFKVEGVGKDAYIITVVPTMYCFRAVRIKVRRPMAVGEGM